MYIQIIVKSDRLKLLFRVILHMDIFWENFQQLKIVNGNFCYVKFDDL